MSTLKLTILFSKMDTKKTPYVKHLSEPWFSLVMLSIKTVEGRLYKNSFTTYIVGDIIKCVNHDFDKRFVSTRITRVTKYTSFEEMLLFEGLHTCLPTISNIEKGVSVYGGYFSSDDEIKHGVVAFGLEKINSSNDE